MSNLNTYTIQRQIHGKLENIVVKAATRREAIRMADDYAANARKAAA